MSKEWEHEAKGSLIRASVDYIILRHGKSAYEEVLRSLSDTDQTAIRKLLPSQWFPEVLLQKLSLVVCEKLLDNSPEKIFEHAYGASEYGAKGAFNMIAWFTSPEFLLKRFPSMWTLTRRGPTKVSVEVENKHAKLVIADFPFMDNINNVPTFRAFITTTVQHSGGKNVVIKETYHSRDRTDLDIVWV